MIGPMDRFAVIVVDLRTGDPKKLPQPFVGDEGRRLAHEEAAKRSDDRNHRAWVVVLQKG